MKRVNINFEYTEVAQTEPKLKIFFYKKNKLFFEDVLYTEIEDPTNKRKTIPLPHPLVYKKEFELNDDEDIVICFEENGLVKADWGETVFDLFLYTIHYALAAMMIGIKGHYGGYFLQACYGYAKRYRLVCKSDATFNLKLKPFTAKCPITWISCNNTNDIFVEEFYRDCNFERDYIIYKKTVIINILVSAIINLINIFTGILMDEKQFTATFSLFLGISAIIYIIRNPLKSRKQFKQLRENNWDLDSFIN